MYNLYVTICTKRTEKHGSDFLFLNKNVDVLHRINVKPLTTDLKRKWPSQRKKKRTINVVFLTKAPSGWKACEEKGSCVLWRVDIHGELTGFSWQQLFSGALSLRSPIAEGSVAAVIIIPRPFVLAAISDHYCCFLWRNCSHLNGYVHIGGSHYFACYFACD